MWVRNAVTRGCNLLLSAIEKSGMLVVDVDFPKGDASSKLNGLFMNMGGKVRVGVKVFYVRGREF